MNKLLIKLAAKKILLSLTEQEIDSIEKKYSTIDEKIKELMTIDLKKYKPAFNCATSNNYHFRKDIFDKNSNEKIMVKKIFFINNNNKNDPQ